MRYFLGWLRRRWLLTALMAVAVLFAGLALANQVTRMEEPSSCPSCHEVESEYAAWAISSHSRIECITCHRGGEGVLQVWKRRLISGTHLVEHWQGGADYPLRAKILPDDSVCERCHTSNRPITPSGDLIIPHAEHVSVTGTPCATCHVEVVHAGVNKRMAAALGKTGGNVEKAREMVRSELANLSPKDRQPSMGTCMQCHDGKKAPGDCQACHSRITIPPNHQEKSWAYAHGRQARQDIQGCVHCHAVVAGTTPPGEKVTLIPGVRNNPFCVSCHTERPVTHGDRWKLEHSREAHLDLEGCLVCHDEKPSPSASGQEIVACAACHAAPHPEKDWRQRHPSVVKNQGAAECFACHDSTSCSNCHTQGRLRLP
ncbi:MAG: hypothetical protein D9V47_09530 [Clostridia bacterium]|nr:MAG: hypothetical protein D9V47_09530 [Clostridia bacterium]